MEIEAVLQANENLNRKITKLQEELNECFMFKEMWERDQKQLREMEKQLQTKREVVRVIVQKGQTNYVLQLTKVLDTKEGLYIEGIL